MRRWFFTLSTLLPFFFWTSSTFARPQESDYMACSISDNGGYVSILAIPQSYLTNMGQENAIVRRSCDTKFVKKSYGWATEYDCTKQIQLLKQILRQLQSSKACPDIDIADSTETDSGDTEQ